MDGLRVFIGVAVAVFVATIVGGGLLRACRRSRGGPGEDALSGYVKIVWVAILTALAALYVAISISCRLSPGRCVR